MITFAELLERAKSEKIAVHTPTEEQAITLFKALDEKGYTWFCGEKLTNTARYEGFREKTCYVFSRDCCGSKLNKEIMYGSLKVHQEHDYTIIEFTNIDFKEAIMEKKITIEISSLVAGCMQRMIVEEIENQETWKETDKVYHLHDSVRDQIISEMEELVEQLESKGINRYFKF